MANGGRKGTLVKLNKQGVRDLSYIEKRRLGMSQQEIVNEARATLREHNPDHDSLFARFEQLETLLDDIVNADDHCPKQARDALTLVGLIRKQVLK
jgi:ribosomal protein S15P/S13E